MTEQTMQQPTAPQPKKRRSSWRRQRRAVIIGAVVVALLAVVFAVVWHFTSRTAFYDWDGTKYTIRAKGGVYFMEDENGEVLRTTSDGNYVTAAGTLVMLDATSGEYTIIAAVDVVGTENLMFNSYNKEFDVLMYPYLERADISSIEVHNENGSFSIVRNDKDELELRGYSGIEIDSTLLSTLVTCTGYTRTLRRLDTGKVKEFGYAEYGLPENPDDATTYFVITDRQGTTHKVVIGDIVPADTGYYARYAGRDEVYVIKQNESSEFNATFEEVMFATVEDFATPIVLVPMNSGNYFDVTDFTLTKITGIDTPDEYKTEELVKFSYQPVEVRRNTFYANIPYFGEGALSGFAINTFHADDCLQNLQSLTPYRVVRLNDEANPLTPTSFAKTYGVAYTIEFYFNNERYGSEKNYAINPNEQYYEQIWISPVTKDDTYYMYNEMFDMVVETDRAFLEFLEWSSFDWVEADIFSGNIAYCKELSLTIKGGTLDLGTTGSAALVGLTDVVFHLDNSKTEQEEGRVNSANLEVTADYTDNTGRHLGVAVNVPQFRLFYQTLIYSSLEGLATCTEEEQEAFRASGDEGADVVLSVTYEAAGQMITRTYRFYRYGGGRQSFATLNGNGSFYMLQNRVQKIINDTGRVFSRESVDVIDPRAKQ